MASLVLGAIGTAIGGSFGGTILGLSGAVIGGMVGSAVGSVVDSLIVASLMPGQSVEGQRLDVLRVTSSTEGGMIPRLYGRMRISGNIIWATDFREEVRTTTVGVLITVAPPAPAVAEPMLTTVVDPEAPPVPRFTVLVVPLVVAPVPTP
jgi:hypothetical protein